MAGDTFLKTMNSASHRQLGLCGEARRNLRHRHIVIKRSDRRKQVHSHGGVGLPNGAAAKKIFRVGRCTGYAPIVHSFSTTGFAVSVVTLPIMRFLPHAAALGLSIAVGTASAAAAAGHAAPDIEVPATAPDGATIFRVFLTDGRSLVSYGAPARVVLRSLDDHP